MLDMPTLHEELAQLSCGMTNELFDQLLQKASDEALFQLGGKDKILIPVHRHERVEWEIKRRLMIAEKEAQQFAFESLAEAKRANQIATESLHQAKAATEIAQRSEGIANRAYEQDRVTLLVAIRSNLIAWIGIAIGVIALVVSVVALFLGK